MHFSDFMTNGIFHQFWHNISFNGPINTGVNESFQDYSWIQDFGTDFP